MSMLGLPKIFLMHLLCSYIASKIWWFGILFVISSVENFLLKIMAVFNTHAATISNDPLQQSTYWKIISAINTNTKYLLNS